MKKIKFIAPNGVEVVGVELLRHNNHIYSSTASKILVYAQNRLILLHQEAKCDAGSNYVKTKSIDVIEDYCVLPECDKFLNNN